MIKKADYNKYKNHAFVSPFLSPEYKAAIFNNYILENPHYEDYKKIEEAIKILKEFEKENVFEYLRIPIEVRKHFGFDPPKKITSNYEQLVALKEIKKIYNRVYFKRYLKFKLTTPIRKAKLKIHEKLLEILENITPKNQKIFLITIGILSFISLFAGIAIQMILKDKIDPATLILIPAAAPVASVSIYLLILYFIYDFIFIQNVKAEEKSINELYEINNKFYKKLKNKFPEVYEAVMKEKKETIEKWEANSGKKFIYQLLKFKLRNEIPTFIKILLLIASFTLILEVFSSTVQKSVDIKIIQKENKK